jgi:hypothetical protein
MLFSFRRDSWRIWLVLGLGLCGYGYYEWSRLRVPTAEELDQLVEAQYRVEIERLQQQAGEQPLDLSREWQHKYRTAIRNERTAPVAQAKKRIHSIFAAGMIMLVMAAGMFVYQRLAQLPASTGGG